MTLPGLVLVHGGAHAGNCWDPTVDEIRRLAPDLTVLSVDLPVVICGHFLAGVIVPSVVAKLGSPRVAEMVLAAAFVPPQDTSVLDTVGGPLGWYARRAVGARRAPVELPRLVARLAFCNGMTRRQKRFALSRLCRESICLVTEKVRRDPLPDDIPRTWILTRRDHSLSARTQSKSID